MQTLHIQLEDRSYPIYIGEGLLSQIKLIEPHLKQKHVPIVTNTTVAPLYLDPLLTLLKQHGIKVFPIILPDGESYKNQETLNLIYDALLKEKCERTTTLIALGGGVIGDMTGYAAATYLRGVPFIQIPTTLLSQVDSSVGGKTGINHPLGKNMIGAFYQPQCVIADIDTLKTLPRREFSAGMAEVIKYGLIRDMLPSRSTFCGDGPSPGNRLISGGRCDLSSESVSALNLVVDRESARPKLLTHNTWLGCVDGPRLTMNRGRVLIFHLWDVLILEFFSYPVKLDVLIRGLLKHALAGYCLLLVSK